MNNCLNTRSLRRKCETNYYEKFFPNNSLLPYNCYAQERRIKPISIDELEKSDVWGMPFALIRDEGDRLTALFHEIAHSLIVGTTQVGKTWGLVINSVYLLSGKKNRANFMITDPKGEISENTAEHLKKRGYTIYALNFKDTRYTNMWNPLLEIYDTWIEIKDIPEIQYHNKLDILQNYELKNDFSDYVLSGGFWSFEGAAYASERGAVNAFNCKKGDIEKQTDSLINQLVSSMGAEAIDKSKDIMWPQGAMEILRGMIYLMLEDALDERSEFTRENMNFLNMQRYYEVIRESILADSGLNNYMKSLVHTKKLQHKETTDQSIRHMRGFLENAPTTTRSYMGVFENIMQNWFNTKIYAIANDNNIDLSNYDKQPFAVFLITRDYEESDYFIAGLFIDWVYKQMIEKADANGGKLDKEMFFILDEFANIPKINSFTNKISTSL